MCCAIPLYRTHVNILYEKSNKIPIGTPDKENTSGKTQKNGTEKSEIVVR